MLISMGFIETEPQINADERRLIISDHRKDRKAQQHSLNFCMEKHSRNRTRMTRRARIFADNRIRGHPRNLCSITFALEGKRSYQYSFSLETHKEAAHGSKGF
jgi:hypothetical protein